MGLARRPSPPAAVGFLLRRASTTNFLERFIAEVQEESAGGVSGVGSVAIRKLGTLNRRFMWPGYEDKMRRSLIKAGEPQSYKPEDIMALQEIGVRRRACSSASSCCNGLD